MEMPTILYGTAWKKERTADLVELALSKGFRGIDTACQPKHYNEPGVGEGIGRAILGGLKREELFLQSKFTSIGGQDPDNIPYDPHTEIEVQIERSLEVTFDNLKTDYLDSLVLHSPFPSIEETLRAWSIFESFVNEGKVKRIGISNCYQFDVLKSVFHESKIKPSILQNRFHSDTGYDIGIRDFCSSHGIAYQSFWTLTANPHILNDESVLKLAQKFEISAAQLFFKYLVSQGIHPLTGTTSGQHMEEDLQIENIQIKSDELSVFAKLLT